MKSCQRDSKTITLDILRHFCELKDVQELALRLCEPQNALFLDPSNDKFFERFAWCLFPTEVRRSAVPTPHTAQSYAECHRPRIGMRYGYSQNTTATRLRTTRRTSRSRIIADPSIRPNGTRGTVRTVVGSTCRTRSCFVYTRRWRGLCT